MIETKKEEGLKRNGMMIRTKKRKNENAMV